MLINWQEPRKASFDEAEMVASPMLHKGRLLCLSAWNRSSVMLQLDRDKPTASVLCKTRSKPTTFIATDYASSRCAIVWPNSRAESKFSPVMMRPSTITSSLRVVGSPSTPPV